VRRATVAAVALGAAVFASGLEGLPLLRLSPAEGRYEPWRDLQILHSMLPLSPGQRDYIGPAFGRDRNYAVFLRGVEKLAPEVDRFFLRVPDMSDWYRYRAAYRLAPTPVELWQGQAPPERDERQVLLVWNLELPPGWEALAEPGGGIVARRISSAAGAAR
jgi:hypothetical protein